MYSWSVGIGAFGLIEPEYPLIRNRTGRSRQGFVEASESYHREIRSSGLDPGASEQVIIHHYQRRGLLSASENVPTHAEKLVQRVGMTAKLTSEAMQGPGWML